MLESLHISNYALIEEMDIEFDKGLNIITGETGAGKSIILGALSLLLGARAENKNGEEQQKKSVVEAIFDISDAPSELKKICLEESIDISDNKIIMRREITPSGRSRSFINDSPVNLTVMDTIGHFLIDIHSQHQNRLLGSEEFQRQLIDAKAANDELLKQYVSEYKEFRSLLRKYKQTKANILKYQEDSDYIQFQLNQIDQLNPQSGELEELLQHQEELAEQVEIDAAASDALQILSEGDDDMLSLLQKLKDACSELEDYLDKDDKIAERLENIDIELTDIAQTIAEIRSDSASSNLSELQATQQRIKAIRSMLSKHNLDSDTQLVELQDKLHRQLSLIEDAPLLLAELEKEVRAARKKAMLTARTISSRRSEAANEFAKQLQAEASPLGMVNLQCFVEVTAADMSETGIDKIEFKFAFNKNQAPISINAGASGGEISRLMLSVKSIATSMLQLPTIVFDEVDTGISGQVASRMGQQMQAMAQNTQVITITHLPQVAASGNKQFKVYKYDDAESTHTSIRALNQEQRVEEIAMMLSGEKATQAAIDTARQLLNN